MLNRWSALMVVVGVVIGYAVAAQDVRAQNAGIPVMLGETVSFVNEDGRVMGGCTVAVVQGDYVGCGKQGDVREWWRMTEVLRIQKVPK